MSMETTTLKRNVWTFPGLMPIHESIKKLICFHFDIGYDELISNQRLNKCTYARHMYRYLLSCIVFDGHNRNKSIRKDRPVGSRKNCLFTLDEIADMTGCIDHSGVVPSIRTAQNLITTDKCYRDKFLLIINSLDKNQLAL